MGIFKWNKHVKKTIMIQWAGLGDLKFESDSKDAVEELFICRDNQIIMTKYKPVIRLYGLSENNIKIYGEVLKYIDSKRELIEKNLKYFYLDSYEKEEVEKGFEISYIENTLYQTLGDIAAFAEKYGTGLGGLDKLEALIINSREDDIFFEINAKYFYNKNQDSDQYASAYINWRTKEFCYCFDVF